MESGSYGTRVVASFFALKVELSIYQYFLVNAISIEGILYPLKTYTASTKDETKFGFSLSILKVDNIEP